MFIRSAAAVSPQASFEKMMAEPENYSGEKLACVEPDYTKYVEAKLIRRMSRVIKMGVAAASESLLTAGVTMPDAIITGTAYGCLADTDQFLTRMVEFNETLLSPTSFIQSTHNTVGAQIALQLHCHNYNTTYVHRGSSFEASLLDAFSLMAEGEANTVLVGGVDEITDKSHAILRRFHLYKKDGQSLQLINGKTKGTMAGEGAAFFVLDNNSTNAMAELVAVKTFYKPTDDAASLAKNFLQENDLNTSDIELVILGNNGDTRYDKHYNELASQLFPQQTTITYKQFCGEYPTSSAFALWMAAHILKDKQHKGRPVKNILIYNNYALQYPSFYLLSAC